MKEIKKIAVTNRNEFIKKVSLDWHFTDDDLSLLSDNEKTMLSKMLAKMLKKRFNNALAKNDDNARELLKQLQSSSLFRVQIVLDF